MKKSVLSLIVGSALLIAPMTASAMTPMTSDGLKDATGQAGVSIAIDNVKLESNIGAVSYIDTDGITTYDGTTGAPTAGTESAIVIGAKHKVQYINAIIGGKTSAYATQLTGADYTYTNTMNAAGDDESLFRTKALTIDAGKCAALTDGFNANLDLIAAGGYTTDDIAGLGKYIAVLGSGLTETTVTGVVIGLPTLEIHTSADNYEISATQAGAVNSGKTYIKIDKAASTMAILSGTLEIAPH